MNVYLFVGIQLSSPSSWGYLFLHSSGYVIFCLVGLLCSDRMAEPGQTEEPGKERLSVASLPIKSLHVWFKTYLQLGTASEKLSLILLVWRQTCESLLVTLKCWVQGSLLLLGASKWTTRGSSQNSHLGSIGLGQGLGVEKGERD